MKIIVGDALTVLRTLSSDSVHCCVTSPPYWGLRSYLPNGIVLKDDAPEWVKNELEKLNIKPIDNRHI